MKHLSTSWDTMLIAAIMVIASVCAQSQAAVNEAEAEEGKVIQIAPDTGPDELDAGPKTRIVAEPAYWIGIRGQSIESDILRTHLQLAEDMGVVVEEVLADSPAAKAGLRRHDIILRANGDAVDNMQVLQSQVRTGKEKPLELKIVRLGKPENIVVVPELRPASLDEPAKPLSRFNAGGLGGDAMQQLMDQFGRRNIGPGMVFRGGGQAFNFNQMPNGVSVSIQRNNNEPAQITIKQGDQTWQIVGDDEASLQQLPEDVRPFVERMLNGQDVVQGFGGEFQFGDINAELERLLPRGLGNLRPQRDGFRQQFDQQEDQLKLRMEQLEERLQQLQERFNEDRPQVPLEKAS